MEDKIISALIGLVGACSSNPKTPHTDSVVLRALAFPVLRPEPDSESISRMLNDIYLEKNAVAPGCATCLSPCGNTSDYDMNRIYRADEEIRDLKMQILSKCRTLAAQACHSMESEENSEAKPAADYEFFYRALSLISYDIEKEQLRELLEEAENME